MTRMSVLVALLVSGCISLRAPAQSIQPVNVQSGEVAFAQLDALVGDWIATTERGATIHISFRLVSGKTALVETFTTSSGRETLTIYHRDGERLIATHYCPQGNQPRLQLTKASTADSLRFGFRDATDLQGEEETHMSAMRIDLLSADRFDKVETYRAGNESETTTLHFHRVAGK